MQSCRPPGLFGEVLAARWLLGSLTWNKESRTGPCVIFDSQREAVRWSELGDAVMSEVSGESTRAEQKTRVFLSYSRKDRSFAENLRDRMVRDGFDSYLDIHDIVKGEPWQERLQSLIFGADVVLFLISPDSVSSEVCDWEVNEAERLGKRILPVVCRAVTDNAVPGRLQRLNYAFLDDEEKWASEYPALCRELNRDIAWVREHTRISERAAVWDRHGRPRDEKLLSPDELRDARAWEARRPVNVALSAVYIAFLDASEAKNAEDRERLLTILGRAFVKPAQQAFAEGRYDAALRLAAAGTVLGEDLDMRFVPERAPTVFLAADAPLRAVLCGHDGQVWTVGFSPDGARLVSSSADRTARVWDAVTGRELLALRGHDGDVSNASFSPCGGKIVTASLDRTARVWDAKTGRELAVLGSHGDAVTLAIFSPDGERIATASNDYLAKIWDSKSGRELVSLRGHDARSASRDHHELRELEFKRQRKPTSKFMHVEFSTDGNRVLTACDDATVRIWGAVSGRQLALLREEKDYDFLLCGGLSPDGRRCVTGSTSGVAHVWDVDSGQRIFSLAHEAERRIWRAAFSPCGKQILTTAESVCHVWTASHGSQIAVLAGHESVVQSASFSPDSSRVVTASADATVRVWDASSGRLVKLLRGHEAPVQNTAFSPDGTRIVSASDAPEDNYVRVWDASISRAMSVISVPGETEGSLVGLSISPDARRIAAVQRSLSNTSALLLDSATGRQVGAIENRSSGNNSAEFSADSSRVLTISDDKSVQVWNAESGEQIASMRVAVPETEYGTLVAVLGPDGAHIAVAENFGKSVQIWNVARGKLSIVLDLQSRGLSTLAFSPDGQVLVAGSHDGTARIWDFSRGQEIAQLEGSGQRVTTIAFSLDGARIAIGSECSHHNETREWTEGGRIRLCDARNGAELLVLRGHQYGIDSAQFNRNGTQIITASSDSIRAWDVSGGGELWVLQASKENLLGAAFSPDGKRVAVASTNQTARVLDAASGDVIMRLDGHESSVTSVAFDPSGQRLLTTSLDRTVRVWDVASSASLLSPAVEVLAAALSNGRGTLTEREMSDLLLRSVEHGNQDLGAALLRRLETSQPGATDRVSARAAILALPLEPTCYLPTRQRLGRDLIDSEGSSTTVMPAGEFKPSEVRAEPTQGTATRSMSMAVVAIIVGALVFCAVAYWLLILRGIAL